MSAIKSTSRIEAEAFPTLVENGEKEQREYKPLVSLVLPAFNEASILEKNLLALCQYMESLEDEYRWEIILINDGSTDETGELAEALASTRENIYVLHHITNFGLGQAFQFAFNYCRGDYVLAMDLDLSYSPDHIKRLLARIRQTKAKIVIASPYMEGGKVSNVPWLRRTLSVWANRFLSKTAKTKLTTLTGMVRVYDGKFLRTLNLKSMGMDINPEIIFKARLLQARIEEIPAHLDWQLQKAAGVKRRSSMKVLRHTMAIILSGFIFRPFMFFMLPGLALLLFSVYVNAWIFVHFLNQYQNFPEHTWFLSRASAAVAAAYQQAPHTFIVGLMSLMLAIQLISLGIMSFQSKRYFEEIFHLGTTIYKSTRKDRTERE